MPLSPRSSGDRRQQILSSLKRRRHPELAENGESDSSLPSAPFIVGYLQTQDGDLIGSIPDGYGVVIIAFGGWESDGSASYNGDITKDQISELRSEDRVVLLSFGGGKADTFPTDLDTWASSFVPSAQNILEDYGFDGIDLDIENTQEASSVDDLITAIQDIITGIGADGYLVTLPPQVAYLYPDSGSDYDVASGGIWNVYAPFVASGQSSAPYVSATWMQLYNAPETPLPPNSSTEEGTVDFAVNSAVLLTEGYTTSWNNTDLEVQLEPEQYAIGFPTAATAASSGYLTPIDIVEAYLQLVEKGIDILGVMGWDIGADSDNHWDFIDTVSSILPKS